MKIYCTRLADKPDLYIWDQIKGTDTWVRTTNNYYVQLLDTPSTFYPDLEVNRVYVPFLHSKLTSDFAVVDCIILDARETTIARPLDMIRTEELRELMGKQ